MAKRKIRPRNPQPVKQPTAITGQIVDETAPGRKSTTATALVTAPAPLAIPQSLDTDPKLDGYLGQLFARSDATPIAAALVPWLAGDLESDKNRQDYMQVIRDFAVAMGAKGVHVLDVTGKHVKLYKAARLKAKHRPRTVAVALSVIRGMYEQLGKDHLVPWNVVADI